MEDVGQRHIEKVSSIIFNLIFMNKLCIYRHYFSFVRILDFSFLQFHDVILKLMICYQLNWNLYHLLISINFSKYWCIHASILSSRIFPSP
jgi:hypothetical protein